VNFALSAVVDHDEKEPLSSLFADLGLEKQPRGNSAGTAQFWFNFSAILGPAREIILWLLTRYPTWNKIHATRLVNAKACEIPLVGREDCLAKALEIIMRRLQSFKDGDVNRKSYPVSFVGASSGLGKSRLLEEIGILLGSMWAAGQFRDFAPSWYASLPLTYNDGNILVDEERNGTISASVSLGLRLLYFGLCPCKRTLKFAAFYDRIPSFMKRSMSPTVAMEVLNFFIAGTSERLGGDGVGILYMPIDEVNYMVFGQNNHEFLKQTLVALSTVCCGSVGSVLLCPILAGTIVQPLLDNFACSGIECIPLPIRQLRDVELKRFMQELSAKEPEAFTGWEVSRSFWKSLLKYGTHPKLLVHYVECVRDCMRSGALDSVNSLDFRMLDKKMNPLVGSLTSDDAFTVTACVKLISDCILTRDVYRTDIVDVGASYGDLETRGHVILVTDNDASVNVNLPPSLLAALLEKHLDQQPSALIALGRVVSAVSHSEIGTWQEFESFCSQFEAAREMLIARCSLDSCASIETMYSRQALYGERVQSLNLRYRPEVRVGRCLHRWQPTKMESLVFADTGQPIRDSDIDSIILNTWDGDFCDTLCFRYDSDGTLWLFAGQMKLYMNTAVTPTMVQDEYKKVSQSLSGSQFADSFVLVIIATHVDRKAFSTLPANCPNCILVCGEGLRAFFSPDLALQAFPFIQGDPVNVNLASLHMLTSSVDGIGEVTAEAIIAERQVRAFSDWDDFETRIKQRARYFRPTNAMKLCLEF
jgi:DNA uptake protein ComE-like DNA-binding protein